jgi:hypothetical protein
MLDRQRLLQIAEDADVIHDQAIPLLAPYRLARAMVCMSVWFFIVFDDIPR